MSGEYITPSSGAGAARHRTTAAPGPGLRPVAPFVVRVSAPAHDEAEVTDSFEVHALAAGPVLNYPDADTAGEAERVVAVLGRLGGTAVPPRSGETDPAWQDGKDEHVLMSLAEADEALARWAGESGDHSGRPSVLLWFGHGVQGSTGPALLVPDAGNKRRNARVTPDMLAYYLHAEQQRRDTEEGHWAIVMIEACNSKNFAKEVHGRFLDPGRPNRARCCWSPRGRRRPRAIWGRSARRWRATSRPRPGRTRCSRCGTCRATSRARSPTPNSSERRPPESCRCG